MLLPIQADKLLPFRMLFLYYEYGDYLAEHDITEVNDSVVEDVIEHMGPATVLYVDLEERDGEIWRGKPWKLRYRRSLTGCIK